MSTAVIELHGVPLTVRYDYRAAEHGRRERGTGVPLEPDYPAEADVEAVFAGNVNITNLLSEDLLDTIRLQCEALEEHAY